MVTMMLMIVQWMLIWWEYKPPSDSCVTKDQSSLVCVYTEYVQIDNNICLCMGGLTQLSVIQEHRRGTYLIASTKDYTNKVREDDENPTDQFYYVINLYFPNDLIPWD